MRTIVLTLLFLTATILVQSQEKGEAEILSPDYTPGLTTGVDLFSAGTPVFNSFLPLNASVNTGVNFGKLYSGSFFQSFISPALTFPVNKKLIVKTTLTYSNTHFNNLFLPDQSGNFNSYSGNINALTFSAAGIYRINDKVHVTGSAFKTLNPSFNNRLNPESLQSEAQGVSVGVGYQINEKTYIGAEINMQQGYPIYNQPFGPFNNSRFNRGYLNPGFSPF